VKRLLYLTTAAVVFMLILVPAALAQDPDPHSPEPHPQVATEEELAGIAGEPVPAQAPVQQHPGEVPDNPGTHSPTAQAGPLPSTGGVSVIVILPAAAVLLVGTGVVAYAVLRRRG
jgi:hypothetical protein